MKLPLCRPTKCVRLDNTTWFLSLATNYAFKLKWSLKSVRGGRQDRVKWIKPWMKKNGNIITACTQASLPSVSISCHISVTKAIHTGNIY